MASFPTRRASDKDKPRALGEIIGELNLAVGKNLPDYAGNGVDKDQDQKLEVKKKTTIAGVLLYPFKKIGNLFGKKKTK